MAKNKTIQSIAKRFKITKTGKVTHRKAGQNHFNARETGKTTRLKRKDQSLSAHHAKTVKVCACV